MRIRAASVTRGAQFLLIQGQGERKCQSYRQAQRRSSATEGRTQADMRHKEEETSGWSGVLCKGTRVRYAFIRDHRREHTVAPLGPSFAGAPTRNLRTTRGSSVRPREGWPRVGRADTDSAWKILRHLGEPAHFKRNVETGRRLQREPRCQAHESQKRRGQMAAIQRTKRRTTE